MYKKGAPNGGRKKGVAQKKKVIEMRSERLMTFDTMPDVGMHPHRPTRGKRDGISNASSTLGIQLAIGRIVRDHHSHRAVRHHRVSMDSHTTLVPLGVHRNENSTRDLWDILWDPRYLHH